MNADAHWPRVPAFRYRLYARRGRELRVLAATPDPAGLGLALVTLDEDAREAGRRLVDEGALGVMDTCPDGMPAPGRWLILPWLRPEVPVTFGARR